MKIKQCRICKNNIKLIFSLGKIPIVNYFLSKEDLKKKEKKYPVNFCLCENCGLAQLDEGISSGKLFSTYHYMSSASLPLREHLEDLAIMCRKKFSLNKNSLVLDIGCNDCVFLHKLKNHGIKTLGVDPARNIASDKGRFNLDVITDFFSSKLAAKIKDKYDRFNLIVASNTMAQIPDLHDFIKGIKVLLANSGVFVAEVGYLSDMVMKKTFDAIYHEHYSYFAFKPLVYLFEKHNLEIFDAEKIPVHGGSLRIFVKHKEDKKRLLSKRIKNLQNTEEKQGISIRSTYDEFANFVKDYKISFLKLLTDIKKSRKSIVGVGAPAKGVVLLNYCNIDRSIVDFIIESTPYKQNRFIPGVHIPVKGEEEIEKKDPPDYFLIFAWTYKDLILKKLEKYRKKGSKVIIPFPKIEIV